MIWLDPLGPNPRAARADSFPADTDDLKFATPTGSKRDQLPSMAGKSSTDCRLPPGLVVGREVCPGRALKKVKDPPVPVVRRALSPLCSRW